VNKLATAVVAASVLGSAAAIGIVTVTRTTAENGVCQVRLPDGGVFEATLVNKPPGTCMSTAVQQVTGK